MANFGTIMRSLCDTLFGNGTSAKPAVFGDGDGASVASPYHKGDIVVFSFLPQPELSGKRFEIIHVAAYDIAGERFEEYTLKGEEGGAYYFSQSVEEGETYISVSRKLKRGQALETFGDADIAAVFEEGFGTLTAVSHPDESLKPWLAGGTYHEVSDCAKGRYYETGRIIGQGEALDYYSLEDGSESFAVDLEVYDGGETDISLTVYHEKSAIAEHWPASEAI